MFVLSILGNSSAAERRSLKANVPGSIPGSPANLMDA